MSDWSFPDGNCRKCKLPRTPEGHDPCLGTLSGVLFACCGHGVAKGYIYFESGQTIRMTVHKIELSSPEKVEQAKVWREHDRYKEFMDQRRATDAAKRNKVKV